MLTGSFDTTNPSDQPLHSESILLKGQAITSQIHLYVILYLHKPAHSHSWLSKVTNQSTSVVDQQSLKPVLFRIVEKTNPFENLSVSFANRILSFLQDLSIEVTLKEFLQMKQRQTCALDVDAGRLSLR